MDLVKQTTLVLATSLISVKQWRHELLDKTSLTQEDIAEYTGESKNTGAVTLTTYQILTWRGDPAAEFTHLELFRARSWAHRLRRSSPLARAGLPGHGGPPGAKAARTDGNARARRLSTERCLRPDRTKAFLRALEGPRATSVDRGRYLRRTSCSHECRAAYGVRASCATISVPGCGRESNEDDPSS